MKYKIFILGGMFIWLGFFIMPYLIIVLVLLFIIGYLGEGVDKTFKKVYKFIKRIIND